MMRYRVKEIFYTLQGEGANAGRPAVFCRFTGCNLWSGRELDREAALCRFCDTDFVGTNGEGGGKYESALALAAAIAAAWPANLRYRDRRFVVCTGGEPLLQLNEMLIGELHRQGFVIAIETNGTRPVPRGVDWICMSPKAGTQCVVRSGHELKLVYPQVGMDPREFERFDFQHFYLQPMDGPDRVDNVGRAVSYCLEHPQWQLSLQRHKFLGLR